MDRAVVEELVRAAREAEDKLWVLRCDSRDSKARAAAERAVDMVRAAIAAAESELNKPIDMGR